PKGGFLSMKRLGFVLALALCTGSSGYAWADSPIGTDTTNTVESDFTQTDSRTAQNQSIRLTLDETRLVRLERDAASVIVTNPAHAQVLLDSPRTLIVMPRLPGTTALHVLDPQGETVLQTNIII